MYSSSFCRKSDVSHLGWSVHSIYSKQGIAVVNGFTTCWGWLNKHFLQCQDCRPGGLPYFGLKKPPHITIHHSATINLHTSLWKHIFLLLASDLPCDLPQAQVMELMHRTLTPEDSRELGPSTGSNGGFIGTYVDFMMGQWGFYGELRGGLLNSCNHQNLLCFDNCF